MEDMRSVQPFVLTTPDLPKYQIRYLGHQNVDEIGCYVFAVKPVKIEGTQRYFSGEVWVDDRDLQIVKSYGRGVGNASRKGDNQFPKFETYREQIDGKYWFPTYTVANDTLHFKSGDQRIRQTIRYEDYSSLARNQDHYGDEAKDDPKPAQPASQSGAVLKAVAAASDKHPNLGAQLNRWTKGMGTISITDTERAEIDRLKGTFLANLNHEVRTPSAASWG